MECRLYCYDHGRQHHSNKHVPCLKTCMGDDAAYFGLVEDTHSGGLWTWVGGPESARGYLGRCATTPKIRMNMFHIIYGTLT